LIKVLITEIIILEKEGVSVNISPFKINNKIINMVSEIHSKLGKMEISLEYKKNLYLRKASKIISVSSSCAIEANTLSIEEVEAIVNGKRVIAPPNEILEVKNAYEAYMKIDEFKPYSVKSFLYAHELLMTNLEEDAGNFRKGDVAVYKNGIPIHIGARPEYVNNLITDLFTWASMSDTNPLILACIIHYEIETVHPFSDGNGRMGRLWQSVILYNYNKLFELIPIETLVYENQQEYYDAIQNSRNVDDSAVFTEYMLDMIIRTIDAFNGDIKLLDNVKDQYLNNLTKKEKEVLKIILSNFNLNDNITMEKLTDKINKSTPTIRIYLMKFTELEILTSSGENKGRKYKINDEILKKD